MTYLVFCDESRQAAERFMVLGGIVIPKTLLQVFNDSMALFRDQQRMHAELKWQKVSNQKLSEYRCFVDHFFALNNSKQAYFNSLIVDSHQVHNHEFNQGSREVGFYKFYYQLLLHCFGHKLCSHDPGAKIHVIMDHRTTSYRLEDLRQILNNGMKSRYGISTRPFITVEPRDSKESEVLQINDILLGAVGFQKNGLHLIAGSRPAKIELANYIAKEAGLPNLKESTPRSQKRFTIWNFRLQKRGAPKV